MGLQHVDIESMLRRIADKRIEEAMQEGKFDNLEGAGKPLDLEPMPADEQARLTWWALRILKNNGFTPDEIQWRKAIDKLKERLAAATKETEVRSLVAEVNYLIPQAEYDGHQRDQFGDRVVGRGGGDCAVSVARRG